MTRRTLLVDDSPTIRCLVRMVLESDGGFTVVDEAGDGEEAIRLAGRHRPDLIVLDLSMPRMGGLEALPHLRAVAPESRVAVFTGFEDPDVADRARRAGAAGVLHKGLDGASLCRGLRDVADGPAGPAPAEERPRRARTDHRAVRPSRAGPVRVAPRAAVAVALVLLALSVYGALVGQAGDGPAYEGGFESVAFHEPGLAGGGHPFTVVVPSLHLRWTVEPDGLVTMASPTTPWPEARAAFTAWYGSGGRGEPAFEAIALTTPDGEVHDGEELV